MFRYMIQQTHLHTCPHTLDYSSTCYRTTGCEPLRGNREPTINTFTFVCQVEVNIVTEKHLHTLRNYPASSCISDSGCWTSPVTYSLGYYDNRWLQYKMSSTTITITRCNRTNYAQWETEMPLLLELNQVYGIIKKSDDKPEEPAGNATPTEKTASKTGWIAMVLPDRLSC